MIGNNEGKSVSVCVMCQEDRLPTPNVHEVVLHDPLAAEHEIGESVDYAVAGRGQGAVLNNVIRCSAAGSVKRALRFDIADMGGPNQVHVIYIIGRLRVPPPASQNT